MVEIAALSGVKPNFGGGGIRTSVKRTGVIKTDKVLNIKKYINTNNMKILI